MHGDDIAIREHLYVLGVPRGGGGRAQLDLWLWRDRPRSNGPAAGRISMCAKSPSVAGEPVACSDRACAGGMMALPPDHPLAYFDFRDDLASDIRNGLAGQTPESFMARARRCAGVDGAQAGQWIERFFNDLKRGMAHKKAKR